MSTTLHNRTGVQSTKGATIRQELEHASTKGEKAASEAKASLKAYAFDEGHFSLVRWVLFVLFWGVDEEEIVLNDAECSVRGVWKGLVIWTKKMQDDHRGLFHDDSFEMIPQLLFIPKRVSLDSSFSIPLQKLPTSRPHNNHERHLRCLLPNLFRPLYIPYIQPPYCSFSWSSLVPLCRLYITNVGFRIRCGWWESR